MANFRVFNFNQPETWATFLEDFQFWIDGKGSTTDAQKRGLLMESLDADTKRNLKKWIAPRQLRAVPNDELVIILDREITPKINWLVNYSLFHKRVQNEGETGANFLSAINILAEACGFGGSTTRIVLAQFVIGLRDRHLKSQLLNKHSTLTESEALQIDNSGLRKERSGNTVDACAERSSSRRVMDVVLFTLFLMGFLNENRKSKRTCDL